MVAVPQKGNNSKSGEFIIPIVLSSLDWMASGTAGKLVQLEYTE